MIKSLFWLSSIGLLLLTCLSSCVAPQTSHLPAQGPWPTQANTGPDLSQHMSQVRKAQYEMKLMVSTIKSRNDQPATFTVESQRLYEQARSKWQTAGQAVASDYYAGLASLSPTTEAAMQAAQQSQDAFRTHYNSPSDHRDLTDYVVNLGILLVTDLFNTGRGYAQQQQRERMAQSIVSEFILPSWYEIPPATASGMPPAYLPPQAPPFSPPAAPAPFYPQQL